MLNEIAIDLDEKKVNLERLHYYIESSQSFLEQLVLKSITEITPLIAGLNDQQLDDFFQVVEDEDEEYATEVSDLSKKQQIKKRTKSVSKVFRKWIGRLSKKQKALLQSWSEKSESTYDYRVTEATQSRDNLRKILENRNNQNLTMSKLQTFVSKPEQFQNDKHQEIVERNRRRFRELLLDTLDTLSQKQKKKLRNKVLSYADDFSELSEQKK